MYARVFKRTAYLSGALAVSSVVANEYLNQRVVHNDAQVQNADKFKPIVTNRPAPPSRSELIDSLKKTEEFDVLIVGGGAVGSGTAVDAATRGLKVALVEKNDYASGTSSKSTKMAHGGVRYLEKAVFQLSKAQLDLVIEALNERASIVSNAPHLASILPIMIPVYHYWQVPYFYVGTKLYDIFAGSQNLKSSYLLSKSSAKAIAPMLDDKNLVAGLVYHDGLFNDARMNATLAITAIENGATCVNYTEVKQLVKDPETGKLKGAIVEDRETGETFEVRAKSIVNATGPFADTILEMDKNPDGKPPSVAQLPKMVVPSAGVHIILPEYYCPKDMGLLDASTSDGRVMFFLPWQGKVLAGTTDTPQKQVPEYPIPTEAEIDDIIKELQKYLQFPVRKEDVLSAWSGIRPLVRNPDNVTGDNVGSTQGLVRSHLIYKTQSGLLTISGGKWTTYREMAQETVDNLVNDFKFDNAKPCATRNMKLAGGENYDANFSSRLIQKYNVPEKIATHLAKNYGTRAPLILELYNANEENQTPVVKQAGKPGTYEDFEFPFTKAELLYSIKYEYTRTPVDFLVRRTRLAFLNARESLKAVDNVVDVLAKELKWSNDTKKKQREFAVDYISKMGVYQTK